MTDDVKGEHKEDGQTRGRLSEETINYFKRVEQVLLENAFEDDEAKETFVKNVFNQIEKDGIQLTRHTLTSKVLERIIPLLNPHQIQSLVLLFKTDIELICRDRFASHVVETLCSSMKSHFDSDDAIEAFLSFCKSLRKLCDILLRDVYGSHILSTVLQVLGGVTVPDVITKSRSSRETKRSKGGNKHKPMTQASSILDEVIVTPVPDNFKKSFAKLSKVIQSDDNFGELLCHRSASPVLQVLLLVCEKVNKKKLNLTCQLIVTRARIFADPYAADEEEDEETIHKLPVVFTDDVGSHLFEAIIQTADKEFFEQLATKCFKRFIISLCIHPVANYLAQTFLRNIKIAEQAEYFVSKLLNFTEDILAAGHMGCIVRLAETIQRLEMVDKQKSFINEISSSLHIPKECNTKPLAKLVITMMTHDVFFNTETKQDKTDDVISKTADVMITKEAINFHGSCLLKSCFLFKKSKSVVESFLTLTPDEHVIIACHPNGCFVYESFFNSEWIPSKQKKKIAELLLDSIYMLSCNKFGSRVVDSLWKTGDEDIQQRLQCILKEHKYKLESDLYGRIILYNCGVKQHVSKMKEIEEEKQKKKRKLFEDILVEPKHGEEEKKLLQPVVKKPKNDDRASKYREQLKALGISFGDAEQADTKDTKEEVHLEVETSRSDDLSDIIHAIEATTKKKKKGKKKNI